MVHFNNDIEHCLTTLQQGGTILYPTDTIWGLGCDATNPIAADKIYSLKQRPANKSFIVLMADERDVMQYVAALDLEVFNFLDKQTTPTTIIYNNAIGLAENILAADGSIAIRICKDEFCKTLIKRFRKPIVSTSANISGVPAPNIFAQVQNTIIQSVDYVVQHRQNDVAIATPSSIYKWINGNAEKLR